MSDTARGIAIGTRTMAIASTPRKDNAEEVAKRRAAMNHEIEQRKKLSRKLQEEKMARAVAQKEERLSKQRDAQQREMFRAKAALDRRAQVLAEEKAKKATVLTKAHAVASRLAGEHKARPIYAFGSSTPREISYLTQLTKEQKVYDRKLTPASDRSSAFGSGSSGGCLAGTSPIRPRISTPALPMTRSLYIRSEARVRAKPIPSIMTQSVMATLKTEPKKSQKMELNESRRASKPGTNSIKKLPNKAEISPRKTPEKIGATLRSKDLLPSRRKKSPEVILHRQAVAHRTMKSPAKTEITRLNEKFVIDNAKELNNNNEMELCDSDKSHNIAKLHDIDGNLISFTKDVVAEADVEVVDNLRKSIIGHSSESGTVDHLSNELNKYKKSGNLNGTSVAVFTPECGEQVVVKDMQNFNPNGSNSEIMFDEQTALSDEANANIIISSTEPIIIDKSQAGEDESKKAVLVDYPEISIGGIVDRCSSEQTNMFPYEAEPVMISLYDELKNNCSLQLHEELPQIDVEPSPNAKIAAVQKKKYFLSPTLADATKTVTQVDKCKIFDKGNMKDVKTPSVIGDEKTTIPADDFRPSNELATLELKPKLEESVVHVSNLIAVEGSEKDRKMAVKSEPVMIEDATTLGSEMRQKALDERELNNKSDGDERQQTDDEKRRAQEEHLEKEQREREMRKAKLASIMSRTRGGNMTPMAVVNPTTQQSIISKDLNADLIKSVDRTNSPTESTPPKNVLSQTAASVLQKLATTNSKLLSVLQRNGSNPSLADELSAADPANNLPGQPDEPASIFST